jgi:hypothetical protein
MKFLLREALIEVRIPQLGGEKRDQRLKTKTASREHVICVLAPIFGSSRNGLLKVSI